LKTLAAEQTYSDRSHAYTLFHTAEIVRKEQLNMSLITLKTVI